jgi:hypothetical protein
MAQGPAADRTLILAGLDGVRSPLPGCHTQDGQGVGARPVCALELLQVCKLFEVSADGYRHQSGPFGAISGNPGPRVQDSRPTGRMVLDKATPDVLIAAIERRQEGDCAHAKTDDLGGGTSVLYVVGMQTADAEFSITQTIERVGYEEEDDESGVWGHGPDDH